MRKIIAQTIMLVACLGFGTFAHAGLISISSVTPSSTFHTYDVNNLINGSGLSGGLHSGDWMTKWITNSTATGTLIFDLGSFFDLSSSSIWNYGGGCCGIDRSTKDLVVEASLDNVTYFAVGSYVLSKPVGVPFAGETIALDTTAQYIKFNLNSNYGDTYIGLSEVQFFGEHAAVPEPATLALFGIGLAGMGFARRKRKSA